MRVVAVYTICPLDDAIEVKLIITRPMVTKTPFTMKSHLIAFMSRLPPNNGARNKVDRPCRKKARLSVTNSAEFGLADVTLPAPQGRR